MANYDIIQDGVPFGANVYSLVPSPMTGTAPETHDIVLPKYPAIDPNQPEEMAWLIEACGIQIDPADSLVVSVIDPNADGPLLSETLSGATSEYWRVLAGEWFPQGAIVRFDTTTGINIRIRLSARQDRA